MSRAGNLARAIGADGALNVSDVAGLAAVASSGSASDLTTGTLPNARLASGAAVANLGYTPVNKAGDILTGPLNVSRRRLTFSSSLNDPNHSIYNNYENIDNEGNWDGMKMNVYLGLKVRVGNAGGVVPSEALDIDASGRMRYPLQPSFRAGTSSSVSISSSSIWQFQTTSGNGKHNVGGHYNTSNGRFTAPISGRYLFYACVISQDTPVTQIADLVILCVNGSVVGYNHRRSNYNSSTGSNGYYVDAVHGIVNLSAGDSVDVRNSSGTTLTQHANANYSIFEGYLVG